MLAALPQAVALHLGPLHDDERLLVLLIAFGPFVVLAVVVYVLRRRDVASESQRARPADRTGRDTP